VRTQLFLVWCLIATGGICILFAGHTAWVNHCLVRDGIQTEGVVTFGGTGAINKPYPGASVYIEFSLPDGTRKSVGFDPQLHYAKGQHVRIVYPKDNPDGAILFRFWEMNLGVSCLIGFGVLIGGTGVFLLFAKRSPSFT